MKNKIIDLLFPKTCLGCNKSGQFLCNSCLQYLYLNILSSPTIDQLDPISKIIVASDYNYPLVKKIIHHYKYNFVKELSDPLALLAIKQLQQTQLLPEKTILVPVPLHPYRLRWRGFNQSQMLAEKINQKLKFPLLNQIIIRQKNTKPQVKFNNQQRQKNIKNAFTLNEKLINSKKISFKDKTFVLIDDVITSGITLQECARTLQKLNPKQIQAAVIAQAK